jgi:hypothetical protein
VTVQGGPADADYLGDAPSGHERGGRQHPGGVELVGGDRRAANRQLPPVALACGGQALDRPLLGDGRLPLRQGAHDLEQQLAVRGGRVHVPLVQGADPDAALAQQRHDVHQVLQAAADAVELRHDERVARLQAREAGVPARSAGLGAGHLVPEDRLGPGRQQAVGLVLDVLLLAALGLGRGDPRVAHCRHGGPISSVSSAVYPMAR